MNKSHNLSACNNQVLVARSIERYYKQKLNGITLSVVSAMTILREKDSKWCLQVPEEDFL